MIRSSINSRNSFTGEKSKTNASPIKVSKDCKKTILKNSSIDKSEEKDFYGFQTPFQSADKLPGTSNIQHQRPSYELKRLSKNSKNVMSTENRSFRNSSINPQSKPQIFDFEKELAGD